MQWVSRADSGQKVGTAAGSGRECTADGGRKQRTSSGRAELEDVVVGRSPCRRSRCWNASHRSSVCSGDRGGSFLAEVGCQPDVIPVPQNSETCTSSRSRPAPATSRSTSSHGWQRGRSNLGLNPLH
eukprot:6717626-Prymnesium_polylepis.1